MKHLVVSKYIFLLLVMIFIGIMIHHTMINPFINTFINHYPCNELANMFLAFVIEPVICIFIVAILINRKEKQIFNNIA